MVLRFIPCSFEIVNSNWILKGMLFVLREYADDYIFVGRLLEIEGEIQSLKSQEIITRYEL